MVEKCALYYPGIKLEPYAHVVHTTVKQVISRRGKNHVQSLQNYCFSLSNMQICGVFVAVVIMVALKLPNEPYKT